MLGRQNHKHAVINSMHFTPCSMLIVKSPFVFKCKHISLLSMKCREKCGACCIAPSISSPIPGMPNGKKAGERCINLDENFWCTIFNHPNRPKVCGSFRAEKLVCGNNQEEAMQILSELE